MTAPIHVAVLADYAEEGWPSMDLVAETLVDRLTREHQGSIEATLVRPPMPRRLGRVPGVRHLPHAGVLDRIAARQHDYLRHARSIRRRFDLYHVIDHTYAHLVHALPRERTLVTCHDVDAFRSVLQPGEERRSLPFRLMTRRILDGLRLAAHVPCDSEATREALETLARVPRERLSVVPNGADTGGSPEPESVSDAQATLLIGPHVEVELLHVGSTIPRKRLDVLLEVFARARTRWPGARLVKVGGPLTGAQRHQARELGVLDGVVSVPFVDRETLSAIYRRATVLLLTSDREGFGLPVVEAMACGTPVLASDIPALREVGAAEATYAPVADIDAWVAALSALVDERDTRPGAWRARRQAGIDRAAQFSWSRYASAVADRYRAIAAAAPGQGGA